MHGRYLQIRKEGLEATEMYYLSKSRQNYATTEVLILRIVRRIHSILSTFGKITFAASHMLMYFFLPLCTNAQNVTTRFLQEEETASFMPFNLLHIKILAGVIIPIALVCSVIAFMQAADGSENRANPLRDPPAWNPERNHIYSFKDWSRDIVLWSIVSELEPARKAAAIQMRLQGTAREFVRSLPMNTIVGGGVVNGVQVEPVGFLMHALAERYAHLGEEVSLDAMSSIMNFDAQSGESIDA